jgi:phage terminase Nu1 subunit (DNA packaging protein)
MLRLENEMETETVSASELSSLLGVSKKTVAAWATAGVVKRTKHGEYDLRESIRGFARHMRDRGGDTTALAAVSASRAELLKIQTERARFALETERGEWVTLADVEANWCSAFRTIRAAVMAIPNRVAARVSGLSREAVYEMDQEVRDALTELARGGYPDPYADDAPQGSAEKTRHTIRRARHDQA